uniref:Uncharacterized protein n=1 Tax=Oryza rufipogon TaxID=4529 RepID=A0A0E0NCL0_ORYRU
MPMVPMVKATMVVKEMNGNEYISGAASVLVSSTGAAGGAAVAVAAAGAASAVAGAASVIAGWLLKKGTAESGNANCKSHQENQKSRHLSIYEFACN